MTYYQSKSDLPKPEVGKKLNRQLGTYTWKIYSKPSEQLFPNRRLLSYPKLTKNMQTYIRCKKHKASTRKHKTIKTTTEMSHWNDQ